jgi:tRNA pseudouridine38-40 synthase
VMAGINFHTPDDIVCLQVRPVPDSFNPRTWTRSKLYRYRILNRKVPCPFRSGLVWHLKPELDVGAISVGLLALEGQHDFSSFRAAGCAARSPVRTIQRVQVLSAADDELHIEFEGHGFLRHQVRIMVGTLVEVGLAKRESADIERVLSSCDRSHAGPTAPAHGLTLVRVDLSDGPEG